MIFLELFITFFKIGLFTFGGGYAMLPLIQKEVLAKGWMPIEDIINFIAVSESTPGPFAINMSTYVGSQMGRTLGGAGSVIGAIVATLGVVLPSLIVILMVAKCYEKFKKSKIVTGCMTGLRPATIGLIASAVAVNGAAVFFPAGVELAQMLSAQFLVSCVIFLTTIIMAFKKAHPILIIIVSAVLGITAGYIFKL